MRSESRRARCGGHEFNTPLRVEGAFFARGKRMLAAASGHAKQARVVSAGDGNVLLSASEEHESELRNYTKLRDSLPSCTTHRP